MNLLAPANNVISQRVLINDRILQLYEADKEPPPEVIFINYLLLAS